MSGAAAFIWVEGGVKLVRGFGFVCVAGLGGEQGQVVIDLHGVAIDDHAVLFACKFYSACGFSAGGGAANDVDGGTVFCHVADCTILCAPVQDFV
jgi:hypothetical protein